MVPPESEPARRPLKSRQTRWAQAVAAALARSDVTPNQISVMSMVFGFVACGCFLGAAQLGPLGRALMLVGAASGIQLRLLCNLIDGMVAVEGGKRTKTGEIYNDAPDRVADVAILAGAGYGITSITWGGDLGWAASVVAVATAYVRYLGAGMGAPQLFLGPMAKPHRMATLTIACLVGVGESLAGSPGYAIPAALGLVVVGGGVTIVRRLLAVARVVNAR